MKVNVVSEKKGKVSIYDFEVYKGDFELSEKELMEKNDMYLYDFLYERISMKYNIDNFKMINFRYVEKYKNFVSLKFELVFE
jgi:hypothetical protein